MQSQLGDTDYFHRFVRWYIALQGLLMLTFMLAASSANAVITDSPGGIVIHGVAAIFRIVSSWLKSSPAVA